MTASLTAGTVVGTGPLAAAAAALRGRAPSATIVAGGLDEVVGLAAAVTGPVVPLAHWRSLCFIGPRWTPGGGGCPRCLRTRAANPGYGPPPAPSPVRAFGGEPGTGWAPGLLRVAAELAVELAVEPVADALVWLVDGRAGTVDRQLLIADSTCPVCAEDPASSLPVFDRPGAPFTKRAPAVLRTREIDDAVVRDYLRQGVGLFKEVTDDLDGPLAASSVQQPVRSGRREPAIGRAETYRAARTVAVLEGLERYASLYRGGGPRAVRAAYADLDDAVDPTTLGLHPMESYRLPGFPFTEYSPDTAMDWLPGHSFATGGPVLVPERAVHWGPRHDGERAFAFETSNGCALGASVEEAALHGLRELVERDSFLLAWYRRLALPELSLDTPGLRPLLRKAELMTGCRFRGFAATMEYRMPSFVLLAESSGGDGPAVVAGAGAHPDPRQALAGGLAELVGAVQYVRYHYAERWAKALAMLADPGLVLAMTDHAALNSLPEARDRFAFLLDAPAPAAEVEPTVRTDSTDIRDDLAVAVGDMTAVGLDVIVVDQTMPELRRNGLHCVKVIVPGLLPMTFGHRYRRTVGLPRLSGPLPYPSGADAEATAALYPHPFP